MEQVYRFIEMLFALERVALYKNAFLRIYDIPIMYFPKFFHPDPSVKRQSGFLIPRFTNNSMVGSGTTIPYFWAMTKDRDMTITPKLYANESILIINSIERKYGMRS